VANWYLQVQRVQERDLRSLERRSMYSIFAPLDPAERLPRELLIEGKRYRQLGRRELAGALWLPSLLGLLNVASWQKFSGLQVVGGVVLLFGGLGLFALSGDRHGRR